METQWFSSYVLYKILSWYFMAFQKRPGLSPSLLKSASLPLSYGFGFHSLVASKYLKTHDLGWILMIQKDSLEAPPAPSFFRKPGKSGVKRIKLKFCVAPSHHHLILSFTSVR